MAKTLPLALAPGYDSGLRVLAAVWIALSCSGCSSGGSSYYASCQQKVVRTWESLYFCDEEAPELASSQWCSEVKQVSKQKHLEQFCDTCNVSESTPDCERLPSVTGTWINGTTLEAGALRSTCSDQLPAAGKIYTCMFTGDPKGCYAEIGCDSDDNCDAKQFFQTTVHKCIQKWSYWHENAKVCLCEGRPYVIGGEQLQAQLEQSTCDGWDTAGVDLGSTTTAGLSQRIRDAKMTKEEQSMLHDFGTLGLEHELKKLVPLAREELQGLSPEARAHWRSAGFAEHAAVGSFAKLCLELLVAGAPPRLVRLAIRAQEEELMHAHIALSMASTEKAKLNRLDFPEHDLKLRKDLHALRSAAVSEGLRGEGHSALRLFDRAKRVATSSSEGARPHLARLTFAMALDEARHAELAEETLAWLEEETGIAAPKVEIHNGEVVMLQADESHDSRHRSSM
eukprot:TRINITY_DN107434_c0_g1_i1.p1 TRINITY_DN107434_c0_g1~~TRINITY_DN107434_c0_g1_i1.p1  ORF type:complete len:453 (-),score=98.36 TRINITY_DN107434_c0_g1_i1:46-1404(-)